MGVVVGGDVVGVDSVGVFEEEIEFDLGVVVYVGIWCVIGEVVFDEGIDDVVVEFVVYV